MLMGVVGHRLIPILGKQLDLHLVLNNLASVLNNLKVEVVEILMIHTLGVSQEPQQQLHLLPLKSHLNQVLAPQMWLMYLVAPLKETAMVASLGMS